GGGEVGGAWGYVELGGRGGAGIRSLVGERQTAMRRKIRQPLPPRRRRVSHGGLAWRNARIHRGQTARATNSARCQYRPSARAGNQPSSSNSRRTGGGRLF